MDGMIDRCFMKELRKYLNRRVVMKRYICVLLICFIAIVMSACERGQMNELIQIDSDYKITKQTPAEYEVVESRFVDNDAANDMAISINYPQINKLKNAKMEQYINEQIENLALSVLNDFVSLQKMNIETTYSVTFASNNIISIMFIVRSFHETQAYPLTRVKTLNIDVLTGERIKLKDIVRIDTNFVDSFSEIFKNQRKYEHGQSAELIDDYIKDFISLEGFFTCDEDYNVDYCSYLTDDSIVISIAVPHSGGSYTFYEAKYSD